MSSHEAAPASTVSRTGQVRPPLEKVIQRTERMSSIPDVALRVMKVAGDPEAGASDLKSIVEADAALCVRVLRCVNSATYAVRTEITDLNQAISFLGLNQIRDLAVTASVCDLFVSDEKIGTYSRPALWKHLVSVGVCARMVAARTGAQEFEDAFLAGLLHDMGIVIFDQSIHPVFRVVMLSLGSKPLVEVERKQVDWDHTVLGAEVASRWNLPGCVVEAMRHHHAPENCPPQYAALVDTVAVANFICSIQDRTSVGKNLVGLPHGSLDRLGIGQEDLKVMACDLDSELDRHRNLLEITGGG